MSSSQSRPMRVLMVTPRYFPLTGGVEMHVHEVAQRLVRLGSDVTVLTTDTTGLLPVSETDAGVKIRRVRAWPKGRDYYFAPAISRIIARGNWDVVHIQSYHTLVAPLAMLAAWRAGVPYVVTFHGGGHSSSLRNAMRGVQGWLLRPLLARAARLVAVAHFEVAMYSKRLRLPAERFVVIPNGSDLGHKHTEPQSKGCRTLIASVGRLERYKGHQWVIAALPKVLEQRPDVHLRIVGTGPYGDELQRLALAHGVSEHVEIGGIPPSDRGAMVAILQEAALVTLLSDYETHPIAALEALSLRRSVLVADTSGLRELAARGLARAVPMTRSPEQVTKAILEQLERPLVPPPLELPTWDDCATGLWDLYHVVNKRLACAS